MQYASKKTLTRNAFMNIPRYINSFNKITFTKLNNNRFVILSANNKYFITYLNIPVTGGVG